MKDLWLAYNSGQDHFSALLFRLIGKADPGNRERLRKGYPEHVAAWEEWQATPTEREFFEKHRTGLMLRGEEQERYNAIFRIQGPNHESG